MKCLELLLFVSMANLTMCSKRTAIEFPPKLLQPDLKHIEYYFDKIARDINAYVHWPNDITFLVQYHDVLDEGSFLNITGNFKVLTKRCLALKIRTAYDNLYFKGGKFYVLNSSSLKPISKNNTVSYLQPNLQTPKKYLSIRYFKLDEIANMIEPFYSKYSYHMDNTLPKSPASFLLLGPRKENFIEYSPWNYDTYDRIVKADGKLRALITTEQNPKKLILSDSVEADALIPDKDKQDVTLSRLVYPKHYRVYSEPVKNVFGVRMATMGVLAEVQESGIKMFNSEDLTFGAQNPARHTISVEDFLEKLKNVDPRYKYPGKMDHRFRPKSTYFQILGHLLEKKVITLNGRVMDEDCPLAIEYETKGSHFLYEEHTLQKLCTNDAKLWGKTDDGKFLTMELSADIELVYIIRKAMITT